MRPLNKTLKSALNIISVVIVVLGYGLLTLASYKKYQATGTLNSLGLLAVNALFIAMYVARRDAKTTSFSFGLWILAFAGTCIPLALRPTVPSTWSTAGEILQGTGILAIICSLLSLRRSFGIVPANRGIRTQGLYRIIRHPLYASELLWMLGFAVANPDAWNVSLWIADCGLQFARACAEERLLTLDPTYAGYRARVKYRLLPFLL